LTDQARALAELVRFFKVGADTDGLSVRDAEALRAPAVPRRAQPVKAGRAKPQQSPTDGDDKHAGQPMFSTRRPPPPNADSDWKEF
jgi:hypothetical protein